MNIGKGKHMNTYKYLLVVQTPSHVQLFVTPAGPSVPHHLPKFAQVHVHPSILSSDALFSFCPQPFPAPQTFPLSQLFASYDQNTRVSASLSVLQTSIQG